MSKFTSFRARLRRCAAFLVVAAVMLWPAKAGAQARSLAGGVGGIKAGGSSSAASATSQTATAATAQSAQSAQAAATASQAQTALAQSVAAFQKLAQQQMAAQQTAKGNGAYNLGTAANPINGISASGLMPVLGSGTLTTTSSSV